MYFHPGKFHGIFNVSSGAGFLYINSSTPLACIEFKHLLPYQKLKSEVMASNSSWVSKQHTFWQKTLEKQCEKCISYQIISYQIISYHINTSCVPSMMNDGPPSSVKNLSRHSELTASSRNVGWILLATIHKNIHAMCLIWNIDWQGLLYAPLISSLTRWLVISIDLKQATIIHLQNLILQHTCLLPKNPKHAPLPHRKSSLSKKAAQQIWIFFVRKFFQQIFKKKTTQHSKKKVCHLFLPKKSCQGSASFS